MNEHGLNFDEWDKVKGQSAYKGKPKAFRSLLKTFSGLGLHSMYSSSNIEGIKSKSKWYLRLAYWRFLYNKHDKKSNKNAGEFSSESFSSGELSSENYASEF